MKVLKMSLKQLLVFPILLGLFIVALQLSTNPSFNSWIQSNLNNVFLLEGHQVGPPNVKPIDGNNTHFYTQQ